MSDNDTSPDHFAWLADCRSQNQKSTVELYRVIAENVVKLNRYPELQFMAHQLTSVAFSLWRAVFLCDVSGDIERQSADLNRFLISLIADNIVLYQTDKNSRNWSFRYYLENAEFRLESMLEISPDMAPLVGAAAPTEKARWRNAQNALEIAIRAFEVAVDAARTIPG